MYVKTDNRYNKRAPIDSAAVLALPYPRDERIHGTAVNLSKGGAFVHAERPPLSVDEALELSVQVRIDAAPTPHFMNCRVVHVQEHGVGLEFDFLETEDWKALESLIVRAPQPRRQA